MILNELVARKGETPACAPLGLWVYGTTAPSRLHRDWCFDAWVGVVVDQLEVVKLERVDLGDLRVHD